MTQTSSSYARFDTSSLSLLSLASSLSSLIHVFSSLWIYIAKSLRTQVNSFAHCTNAMVGHASTGEIFIFMMVAHTVIVGGGVLYVCGSMRRSDRMKKSESEEKKVSELKLRAIGASRIR